MIREVDTRETGALACRIRFVPVRCGAVDPVMGDGVTCHHTSTKNRHVQSRNQAVMGEAREASRFLARPALPHVLRLHGALRKQTRQLALGLPWQAAAPSCLAQHKNVRRQCHHKPSVRKLPAGPVGARSFSFWPPGCA